MVLIVCHPGEENKKVRSQNSGFSYAGLRVTLSAELRNYCAHKVKLSIHVSLCVKMQSSEVYFLAVSTAELAPFSISYPSGYSQAAQSVGTVRVAMSLGAPQLMWCRAGLNSCVSRLW